MTMLFLGQSHGLINVLSCLSWYWHVFKTWLPNVAGYHSVSCDHDHDIIGTGWCHCLLIIIMVFFPDSVTSLVCVCWSWPCHVFRRGWFLHSVFTGHGQGMFSGWHMSLVSVHWSWSRYVFRIVWCHWSVFTDHAKACFQDSVMSLVCIHWSCWRHVFRTACHWSVFTDLDKVTIPCSLVMILACFGDIMSLVCVHWHQSLDWMM